MWWPVLSVRCTKVPQKDTKEKEFLRSTKGKSLNIHEVVPKIKWWPGPEQILIRIWIVIRTEMCTTKSKIILIVICTEMCMTKTDKKMDSHSYRDVLTKPKRIWIQKSIIIWIVIRTEMCMTKTKNNIDSHSYRVVHDKTCTNMDSHLYKIVHDKNLF